ncbi:MAG: hypothetical protein IPO25_22600 [Saprospiraceae bacterium]|nr:hypothetical protein [Saprospiraceae bacterium]
MIESQLKNKTISSSFIDKKADHGIQYEYKIIALDEAGHFSNSAFTYKIMTTPKNTPADIKIRKILPTVSESNTPMANYLTIHL